MARATVEERLAKIGSDAAVRLDDAHVIYVVTLLFGDLALWGDIIEAIEAEGWRLIEFEIFNGPNAVAVFRAAGES